MLRIVVWFRIKNPLIRLYCLQQLLMGINIAGFYVYTPLFLPHLGLEQSSWVGAMLGIVAIMIILSQGFWARQVQTRKRYKLPLQVGFFSYIPLFFLLAVQAHWALFFAYLIVHGVLNFAFAPSSKTHVAEADPKNAIDNLSRLQAYESAGVVLGNGACALVFSLLGNSVQVYTGVFGVLAFLNLASFILYQKIFPADISSISANRIEPERQTSILGHSLFLLALAFLVIIGAAGNFFGNFYGRYILEVLHGHEVQIAAIGVFGRIMRVFSYIWYGRYVKKRGGMLGLLLCLNLYLVCFACLIFVRDPWLFVLVYIWPFFPLLRISMSALVLQWFPAEKHPLGFSAMESSIQLSALLSAFFGVVLFYQYPLSYLPVFNFLLLFPGVCVLFFLFRLKKESPSSV